MAPGPRAAGADGASGGWSGHPHRKVPGLPHPDGRQRRFSVIAFDSAYTSRWGRELWLTPLQEQASPIPPAATTRPRW